eukprot:8075835-Pyramimonas_sp.AAC.1
MRGRRTYSSGPRASNRYSVDVKGNHVDVTGNHVDVKGNPVDVKGNGAGSSHIRARALTSSGPRVYNR